MRTFYSLTSSSWFVLLVAVVGCHQDPTIPASGIPGTCQIYRIANINEGVSDTTTYAYNSFGHVEEVTFRQWTNGALTNNTRQNFTYSADHFLVSRSDQTTLYGVNGSQTRDNKGYLYSYQDGLIQQVVINNALSGQTLGYNKYTYESGKVKTYIEANAQQQPVRSYTFDSSGKLTQVTEVGATTTVGTNGKVATRTLTNGTKVSYQFDGQGQLISSDSTTSANSQTKRTYSYDSYPYWNKTQLLFRGIPSLDLGGHSHVHNLIETTVTQTLNGRTTPEKLTYQRTYTKAGYTLGYSRGDGAKQRIVYTNCL
jgi:YD repeat-containing protein